MGSSRKILVVNGPNLNLLGTREPATYGTTTLADIEQRLRDQVQKTSVELAVFQSNAEAELVERIQRAGREKFDFIIINPAAFTHTSVALRDALSAAAIPFVEVHLSNVYAREGFRRHSYLADLAVGVIGGWGAPGYELALAFVLERLGVPSSHAAR